MPETRLATDVLAIARRVLAAEGGALLQLSTSINSSFVEASALLLACTGRVIVTGMGKSGHIAHKVAASLSSTGTAAQFLHPAEAVHGDLGVVTDKDILLALSYSGETQEIMDMIPAVRVRGVPVVSITASSSSTLGRASQIVIQLGAVEEADPYNLVPTTTTLLTLAVCDALVVSLMAARGFTDADFATYHPRGALGKRLTLQVRDLLNGDATNPVVQGSATLGHVLGIISRHALGGACVLGEDGKLAGLITDGDIRRIFERLAEAGTTLSEAMSTPVSELMTRSPLAVPDTCLAYEALGLMEEHKPRPIFVLPVVQPDGSPAGLLHLHALVQAGFKSSSLG